MLYVLRRNICHNVFALWVSNLTHIQILPVQRLTLAEVNHAILQPYAKILLMVLHASVHKEKLEIPLLQAVGLKGFANQIKTVLHHLYAKMEDAVILVRTYAELTHYARLLEEMLRALAFRDSKVQEKEDVFGFQNPVKVMQTVKEAYVFEISAKLSAEIQLTVPRVKDVSPVCACYHVSAITSAQILKLVLEDFVSMVADQMQNA